MRRAGTRRHQVELQRTTRTTVPTGFTENWVTYATVWAAIEPVAASQAERLVSNTLQVPVSHLVTLDYCADVAAKDRVRWGARSLHIQGWQNEDERDKTLVLACEERAE